ncbi:MAG: hypothetical protein RDU25_02835 [Patescibacteria group bacterium]|nr:hypothetical protein [Patescibacteria group bacterium]
MSYRSYLFIMLAGTIVAWSGWISVLMRINPKEAGLLGLTSFYVTLLMGMVGLVTLVELLINVHLMKKKELLIREVKMAFRHAVLLALICVLSLIFSSVGKFSFWILLVFIAVAAGIEYLFMVVSHSWRD